MPTPRAHGGAQLAMIPLTTPGFMGLNTQQSTGVLGPEWATFLENAVIDNNSRVAARKGWESVTTSPVADDLVQLHNYEKADGTQYLIASSATALYSSSNGGVSWSDVTNSIAFTAGNWQFVNFNDFVIGIQQGEVFIHGQGGNFTQSVAASAPSGNAICSAFGRLWASDSDGLTLRYCALLDHTDWSGSDAGVFDLTNVWSGADTIQAIAEFNGALVVFGKRNIVMYTDGQGSALGIDPVNMYVVDVISGTGCIARESVQLVDGDLWFLSYNGLQSLGRLVTQKSNPLDNLSKNVQDYINASLVGYTITNLRSAYSPKDRVYLLSLPTSGGGGQTIVFDTRGRLQDGSARCMGTWDLAPSGFAVNLSENLYMTWLAVQGEVGTYTGDNDDGVTFTFSYESGWLDLTQQGYLLMPKRYGGVFFTDADISVDFRWGFDFDDSFKSRVKSFAIPTGSAVWGTAVWGTAEWGGGVSLRQGRVAGRGSGEYIKLGINADVTGSTFAVQQLELFCKVGRYA